MPGHLTAAAPNEVLGDRLTSALFVGRAARGLPSCCLGDGSPTSQGSDRFGRRWSERSDNGEHRRSASRVARSSSAHSKQASRKTGIASNASRSERSAINGSARTRIAGSGGIR